jgi:hypothetical protein
MPFEPIFIALRCFVRLVLSPKWPENNEISEMKVGLDAKTIFHANAGASPLIFVIIRKLGAFMNRAPACVD